MKTLNVNDAIDVSNDTVNLCAHIIVGFSYTKKFALVTHNLYPFSTKMPPIIRKQVLKFIKTIIIYLIIWDN